MRFSGSYVVVSCDVNIYKKDKLQQQQQKGFQVFICFNVKSHIWEVSVLRNNGGLCLTNQYSVLVSSVYLEP